MSTPPIIFLTVPLAAILLSAGPAGAVILTNPAVTSAAGVGRGGEQCAAQTFT